MTQMTDSPLWCRGLTRSFARTQVLAGVDLELTPGSVTGLVGRNGAGKTTLIKCLLGLLKRDDGTAQTLGVEPWDLTDAAKEQLGYVAQQPDLPGWLNVRQCLAYVGAFYPTWDAAMALDLASRWELPEKTKVKALSAGQLQVLAIIAALGHRPKLLVLDEPAAALDPLARRRFLQELLGVVGRGGTVLFSTHLTADLERVADRVAVLRHGKVVFHGALDELIDRTKRLRCVFPQQPEQPLPRPAIAGLLSWTSGPTGSLAVVHGDIAAATAVLQASGATVTVDDLNLEDILVELHR